MNVGATQSQPCVCFRTAASHRSIALASTRTLPARSEFDRCRTHSSYKRDGLDAPQHSARRRAGSACSAAHSAIAWRLGPAPVSGVRCAALPVVFSDAAPAGVSEDEQPVGRHATSANAPTTREEERERRVSTVGRTRETAARISACGDCRSAVRHRGSSKRRSEPRVPSGSRTGRVATSRRTPRRSRRRCRTARRPCRAPATNRRASEPRRCVPNPRRPVALGRERDSDEARADCSTARAPSTHQSASARVTSSIRRATAPSAVTYAILRRASSAR